MTVRYEIRVRGRVTESLARHLGLEAEVRPVETVLHGEARDRVELHTLLDRLESVGIDVVEFREASRRATRDASSPRPGG